MSPDLIPPTPQPPRFDYPTLAPTPKATVFGSSESISSHIVKNSRRKWLLWLGIGVLLLAIIAILLVVIFRQPGGRLNSNANGQYGDGINVSIGDINGDENNINISIGNSGNSVNNTDGATTSGQTLHLQTADSTHTGLLTAADWNTFNDKQPTGFYLTHETDPAWVAAAVSYFNLSQNEVITGIPAFNGGLGGLFAPFSVNSTFLVTNLNADLLDGLQAIDFAPVGGSGNYIQNQTLAQQTADFWIAGRGQADTGLLTPELDVANAGILSLGTATATALSLGQAGITTTNAGALIISQLLTGSLGANVTGATVSLNANSNFDTNINTGTSTGTITIGGGSGTLAVDTTSWDISSAGVISGATGITSSGNITFSALTANRLVTTTAGGQLATTISSTDLAASVTDETGSGALVFGTSPTVSTLTVSSGGIGVTGNSTITGTLASLTGLTSSGTITFSGLNTAGIVTNTAGGVLGTILLVPLANGGTNANLTASNGGVVWSNATQMQILAGTATAGQCLLSGSNTTPSWDSCAVSGATYFTLAGTTGTPQSINGGDTATIAQGTNITTVAGATDTVTVNVVNNPTFSGLMTGQLGLTVSGATASLNASSNFDTNINTGTSTGAVTIGGGNGTFALDSTAFDVTTAGALSGITTISTSSTINSQTISNAASFTGTVNAVTGYQVNGAATSGNVLRGDGTNFVSATLGGGDITGAALTEVDDTNVTLTLTGSPTNALLRATGLTLGWAGQLSVARGGTGASSLNDLITLATHTTGDYVATITGSGTITSTGATSGENIAHTLSVTADSIGDTQLAYNTGQNLTTASSPSFAGLTLTGALGMGANTITSGLINGQTISSTANFTGTVVAATSLSAPQLISTVATGTAPLSVTSTTLVTNLNADLLDGHDATYFQIAGPYLTVESDTLATVTGRGATTSTDSSFTGGLTVNNLTMADATNIILNATTGTKIGTATNQKLGFYNATPIVQPSGNALTALSNLGLIATPTLTSSDVGLGNVTNNAQLVSGNSTQNGYFGDIYLYDDSTPSHYLQITNSANLTAAHVLSLDVNDANRSISISGDLSLAGSLTTVGAYASTFTMTNTTTVTFPTSGTLATTSQLHTQNSDTGTDGANFTIGDGSTTLTIDTSATNDSFTIEQGAFDSILNFTQPGAANQTYTFATGGTVCTTGSVCTGYQPSGPYLTVETDPIWVAAASSYFNLSDSETITGIPAFNGGTTGSTSPFSVDSTYLVTNLNADLLDGYDTSMTAGNSTVVVRNASGYVLANYFNTTADVTAASASHFAIQTGSDNFIRWQTPADARTSLGVVAAGAGDIWVEKAGDSMSGNLTMSGSTANIILGSNYLSGDGGDEGIYVDSTGQVGIGITSPTASLSVYRTGTYGIGSMVTTDNNAADWNLNAQLLISGAAGSNGLALGVSGTPNDRISFIQSGHPDTAYASNLGTLALNPFGGNVGIGTASPSRKLEVKGIIRADDASNGGAFMEGASGVAYFGSLGADDIHLYTNSGDKMTILSGGNVGIGTTGPLSKLDVVGQGIVANGSYGTHTAPLSTSAFEANIAWNSLITLGDRGADLGNPAITLYRTSGGLRTGIGKRISSTYGNLLFETGSAANYGSETYTTNMVIDSTGNVGIGITNPLAALHVVDEIRNSGANSAFVAVDRADGTSKMAIYLNNGYLNFDDYAVGTRMTINRSSGNVGIGTTSPVYKLQVNGDIGINPGSSLTFGTSGTSRIIGTEGVGSYLSLYTYGTEKMRIIENGNVGIGTTNPSYLLDVSGGTGIVGQFSGRVIGGNAVNSNEFATLGQIAGGAGQFWQRTSGSLAPSSITDALNVGAIASTSALFHVPGTTNDNAWFNLGTGNVGIGTTSPVYKLDVNGSARVAGPYLYIGAPSISVNSNNMYLNGGAAGASLFIRPNGDGSAVGSAVFNASGVHQFFDSTGTTEQVRFNNGNVGIGTTSPSSPLSVVTTSDYALSIQDNQTATTWMHLGKLLAPNMTIGNNAVIEFGQASSSKNDGYIGFNYTSSGSNNNFLTLGLHSQDNVLNITGAGNVGIGTTSPAYPLDVNGNVRITGTNNIIWGTGGTYDVRYGLGYNSTFGGMDFYEAGVANGRLFIQNTTGNVGIGTTNPGAKLEVNGQVKITGGSPGAGYVLTSDATGLASWADIGSSGGPWTLLGNNLYPDSTSNNVAIGATDAGTAKLYVNGNVGIGTTVPHDKLEIRGLATGIRLFSNFSSDGENNTELNSINFYKHVDAGPSQTIKIYNISTFAEQGYGGSDLRFQFMSPTTYTMTDRVTFKSNGNVGIGTTNPASLLNLSGAAPNIRIDDTTAYNASPAGTLEFVGKYNSGGGLDGFAKIVGFKENATDGNAAAGLAFYTNTSVATLTEKMRVTSGGNVGIGTTSPVAQLHVVGTTTANAVTNGSYTGGGRGHPYWPDTWLGGYSSIPGAGSGGITTYGGYFGGNAGGLFYGGNGSYVGGGGAGVTAIGGNGGQYGEGGAGIYAQGGTNGSSFYPSETPYANAPAGYFNGNVFVMSGAVGIGTTSPLATLEVNGAIRSTRTAVATQYVQLSGGDAGAMYLTANPSSGNEKNFVINNAGSAAATNTSILFQIASATKVIIDNTGNVGIGTTSPGAKLQVLGPEQAAGGANTSSGIARITAPDEELAIGGTFNGGNRYMWLQGRHPSTSYDTDYYNLALNPLGGNVGIGTTSPGAKLEVNGQVKITGGTPGTNKVLTSDANGLASWSTVTGAGGIGGGGTLNYVPKFTPDGSNIGNSSIFDNGNVGIGTTNPLAKLVVNGNIRTGLSSDSVNYYLETAARVVGAGDVDWDFNVHNISSDRTIMSFDQSTGNVGIGKTIPNSRLDIGSAQGSGITMSYDTGNGYMAQIVPYWNSGTDTRIDFNINSVVNTTPLTIMSVGYGGNVGIGTTNPGYKLENTGSSNTQGMAYFSYGNTAAAGYSWMNAALTTNSIEIVNSNATVTTSSPTLGFHRYGSGGPQFRLDPAGTNILYLESANTSSARGGTAPGGGYFASLRLTPTDANGIYINGNSIWHAGNDGSGSGLDADLLDGSHASSFMSSGADSWVNTTGDTMTNTLNIVANSLTSGTGLYLSSSSLNSGKMVDIQMTASPANTSTYLTGLNISMTGGTAGFTSESYGARIINNNTNSLGLNYGLYVNAYGGGFGNTGIYVAGGGITVANGGINITDGALAITDSTGMARILSTADSGFTFFADSDANGADTGTAFAVRSNSSNMSTGSATFTILQDGAIYAYGLDAANGHRFLCFDTTTYEITHNTTCNLSSIRYKENVQDLGSALSVLGQLRPVSFDWKASSGQTATNGGINDYGLIAEEVNNILPEMVSWSNGQIDGLKYENLVPWLVAGVQEQQVEINVITGRVDDLDYQMSLLSNGLTTVQSFLDISGNAKLSNLEVTDDALFDGDLIVKGNTTVASITVNGHIISAGETPVITAGLAAGNNAVTAVLGNDTSGTITITTGTNTSTDSLVEVVFKQPFGKQPKVILTPNNSDTAKLEYYYNSFTNKFGIYLNQSPTTNTEYKFSYFVIE